MGPTTTASMRLHCSNSSASSDKQFSFPSTNSSHCGQSDLSKNHTRSCHTQDRSVYMGAPRHRMIHIFIKGGNLDKHEQREDGVENNGENYHV